MASLNPKDFGMTVAEVAAALRVMSTAGLSTAQAVNELGDAMRNLGFVMRQEAKSDVIKLKKIVVKPPKYRLIRDE